MSATDITTLDDEDLIDHIGARFTWELDYLKRAVPSAESSGIIQKDAHPSPSIRLSGKDYVEVNRTILSILALRWILKGDYKTFTGPQPRKGRLQYTSFVSLQALFRRWLLTPHDQHVLVIATMVADVGKAPDLALEVEQTGSGVTHNHDELIFKAAKARVIPCLENLNHSDRNDILTGLEFASKLNIPQLAQAENVPGSLTEVLAYKGQSRAVHLKILEVFLDVAGAAAQKSCNGSATMTEDVYQTLTSTVNALMEFIESGKMTETQCYNRILIARAELLLHNGLHARLDIDNSEDRALLRLLCMGRVATPNLVEAFREALDELGDRKADLVAQLNASGRSHDDVAIIPYYAPALFAHVLKPASDVQSKLGPNNTIKHSLALILEAMSQACKAIRSDEHNEQVFILEVDLSSIVSKLDVGGQDARIKHITRG